MLQSLALHGWRGRHIRPHPAPWGVRMDRDFPLDLDEARSSIEQAETLALYFPYFRKTLLLDLRTTPVDPPLVRVVPMVRSGEERLRVLAQLRPRLGRPESVTMIAWPRYVSSVKALGVWQAAVDRMAATGWPQAEAALERCYRELLAEERAELLRACTGDGYRTVWQRRRASEV